MPQRSSTSECFLFYRYLPRWLYLTSYVLTTFVYRSPPKIPEVAIPEKPLMEIVSALRIEINKGFAALRDIASGKDLKKFLAVSLFLLQSLIIYDLFFIFIFYKYFLVELICWRVYYSGYYWVVVRVNRHQLLQLFDIGLHK